MPTDEPERWRVFLAIEVPEAVREPLSRALNALQPLHEAIRINPVERMHLTLHFLGQLSRSDVEHLETALAPTVVRHQRFRLTAEGVGAFPDIRRPRVVWAGIGGADLPKLIALQADLGDGLRHAAMSVEDRFHAHLTLGRVRRPLNAQERTMLSDWSARWAGAAFGDVPVDRIRLLRSQLGGGPPKYTTLATFDLQ
jgi:2'-5' RNA ligase